MKVSAYGTSDVGLVRTNNEDSFCFDDKLNIFILADGMGGHNAGEIASSKAIQTVFENFNIAKDDKSNYITKTKKDYHSDISFIENVISISIMEANQNIYMESISNNDVSGMGTTLDFLTLYYGNYYIGHIGDSRVYLLRDEKLIQVTEDHSVVNELILQKVLTKEEGRYHPYSHILTNALGVQAEISFDIISGEYKESDLFLLCSDGLSDMIGDRSIHSILKQKDKTLKEKADLLIESAKYSSGLDNITLILVEIIEK